MSQPPGSADDAPLREPQSRARELSVEALDELMARWSAGERCLAEELLGARPALAADADAALDVIYCEILCRRERGEQPEALEYMVRFPHLASALARQFEWLSALGSGAWSEDGAQPESSDPQVYPAPDETVSLPHTLSHEGRAFTLLRRLGAGTMGVVYEARDEHWQESVALKTLRRRRPREIERLKSEFRLLADLAHPNLAAYYELFSSQDQWFFTMELAAGVDIAAYVRGDVQHTSHETGRPLASAPEEARLRSALGQLAAGLTALHERGILHCDLKPANILTDRDGRVMLLDFGLALRLEELAGEAPRIARHCLAGTWAFMSPDRRLGRPATSADDWYSAGAILHLLLYGELPGPLPPRECLLSQRWAELCARLLEPNAEQRAGADEVFARLGLGAASPRRQALAHPAFVGRARELQTLRETWNAAADRPAVLLVHGPSGMGKTSLVRQFLAEVTAAGGLVFRGRCEERETVPFGAFETVVAGVVERLANAREDGRLEAIPEASALARLFPTVERLRAPASESPREPLEERRLAVAALEQLLHSLTNDRRVVVWLDDAQWGDDDSAALLESLAGSLGSPAITWVLSCRDELQARPTPLLEAAQKLSQYLTQCDVPLGPLPANEARMLADALVGADPSDSSETDRLPAEALVRESAGAPYLMCELASLPPARLGGPASRLDELLLLRAADLPEDARRLLEAVALAAGPVELELAARAAKLAHPRRAATILTASRFVKSTERDGLPALDAFHDRVRESLVARVPAQRQVETQRAFVALLEDRPVVDPERLMVHARAAQDPERIRRYGELAGDRASHQLAFDRAAHCYRWALETYAPAAAESQDLAVKLADCLANTGRGRESALTLLDAARRPGAADPASLSARAGEQLLRSGHPEEGLPLIRSYLRSVGCELLEWPWLAQLRVFWHVACLTISEPFIRVRPGDAAQEQEAKRLRQALVPALLMVHYDPVRGMELALRLMRRSLRSGQPALVAFAQAAIAGSASYSGEPNRPLTMRWLRRAQRLVRTTSDQFVRTFVCNGRASVNLMTGRWRKALLHTERAFDLAERLPDPHSIRMITLLYTSWALFYSGRWTEYQSRLTPYVDDAHARDDHLTLSQVAIGPYSARLLAAHQPVRAQAEMEDIASRFDPDEPHLHQTFLIFATAQVLLYTGQAAQACQLLEEKARLFKRAGGAQLQILRVAQAELTGRCQLAAIVAGQAAPAAPVRVQSMIAVLRRERVAWASALAACLEVGLRRAQGTPPAGELEEQVALELDRLDMGLWAMAARRRATPNPAERARLTDRIAKETGAVEPERIARLLAP